MLLLILFHAESNHLWFWYFQLILVLMLRDETNVDELLNTILGYWIKITISSSWILINWLPKLKIEMKQIEIPLSSSNKVHLVKHFNNQLLIHSNSYLDILKCYINYDLVIQFLMRISYLFWLIVYCLKYPVFISQCSMLNICYLGKIANHFDRMLNIQ